MKLIIRKVQPGEEADLWQLFYHTIRQVNARDYALLPAPILSLVGWRA